MPKNLHRIFVALEVKKVIANALVREEEWIDKELGTLINWIQPEDMHITLVPPWYADDNQVAQTIQHLKAAEYIAFGVDLKRITFGPNEKKPNVVWVEIAPNEALTQLKNKVEKLLNVKVDEREFRPHITLAWLSDDDKSKLKGVGLDRKLKLAYEAEAVLVMESVKEGSHRYDVLQKIGFEYD